MAKKAIFKMAAVAISNFKKIQLCYHVTLIGLQNREFWRILRQNPSRGLGCSELQEPKKTNTFWVCNLARKVTHARKGNPWANRDERLQGPRRNHLCQFL